MGYWPGFKSVSTPLQIGLMMITIVSPLPSKLMADTLALLASPAVEVRVVRVATVQLQEMELPHLLKEIPDFEFTVTVCVNKSSSNCRATAVGSPHVRLFVSNIPFWPTLAFIKNGYLFTLKVMI